MDQRPLDIILFGATGFTGQLVAEYLAEHAGENGVRWGIAGRSRAKLEAVRRELAAKNSALADLPIYIADSHDVAALDALVPETRVVCTTVGPYAKYGMDLARACARHGTSYCDLTGEANFVRTVIDQCHDLARSNRARLVTCSGYDSIPSDLGAYIAWEHSKRTHGEGLAWVKVFTGRTKGTPSGGTIASAFGIMDAAKKDRDVRRTLLDPHGLDPQRGTGPRDPFEDDQRAIRFDKDLGRWTAPFVMASINTRIVRRSHALLKEEAASAGSTSGGYGPSFRYNEAMSFRRGARGAVTASLVTASIGGLFAAAAFPPARAILERVVLKPGEGPSREAIDRGFFEMLILAKTESGKRLRGRIAGTKDPGYGGTAKMLSESAMCLAKDPLESRFGVLTPATAMGMALVTRLRNAGMTLDIHDA